MPKLDEKIHLESQKYAQARYDQARQKRREKKIVPVDPDPDRTIYLAHYEGYKAGARAMAKKYRDKMRRDGVEEGRLAGSAALNPTTASNDGNPLADMLPHVCD